MGWYISGPFEAVACTTKTLELKPILFLELLLFLFFYQLGLLKLPDIYMFNPLVRIYKSIGNGQFINEPNINARNNNLATPSFHSLASTQHASSYTGPTQWNDI